MKAISQSPYPYNFNKISLEEIINSIRSRDIGQSFEDNYTHNDDYINVVLTSNSQLTYETPEEWIRQTNLWKTGRGFQIATWPAFEGPFSGMSAAVGSRSGYRGEAACSLLWLAGCLKLSGCLSVYKSRHHCCLVHFQHLIWNQIGYVNRARRILSNSGDYTLIYK